MIPSARGFALIAYPLILVDFRVIRSSVALFVRVQTNDISGFQRGHKNALVSCTQ